MDRRREPSIRAYETVQLTVLGDGGHIHSANAVQLSAQGIRLILNQPIPVSAAVKVVCDDWLALGEVRYCKLDRGHYVVGLQLDHVLVGLEDLAGQNRNFSGEKPLPALDEADQLLS